MPQVSASITVVPFEKYIRKITIEVKGDTKGQRAGLSPLDGAS
jgi:hypothetical protein